MAKIEEKTNMKMSKKRKRNELTIVESSPSTKFKRMDISSTDASLPVTHEKGSHKRKIPNELEIKSKKKLRNKKPHNSDDEDDDNETEIREPSYVEIMESLKPENQIDIETVRGKKKSKHQKLIQSKQHDGKQKEHEKNADYLRRWKTNRREWKFEKLRQISIQNHLFDVPGMDSDLWSIAIDYLAGTKGAAKVCIVEKAEAMIKSIDAQINAVNKRKLTGSQSYERAREILQLLL